MTSWRTVASDRETHPVRAEHELTQAYQMIFCRNNENAEIVAADLAAFCGFYQVEPPGSDLTPYQAGYTNGLRAAFGRLFHFLSLTAAQLEALEKAAREENRVQFNEE